MGKKYEQATEICFQIIEKGYTECLEAINTWILCSGMLHFVCYAIIIEAQGKDEEVMFLRAIKNDIADHKSRKKGDYSNWVALAEKWEAKGNFQWAYLCYVRALRKCRDNKELQRATALCCLKMGKNYKYLNIMKNKVLKSPIPEDFLQDVLQTANLYKESKKPELACEILETAFKDMKNGKVAFQLFKALEELQDYRKILQIYNSHYQLLKATELAPELEILYLIALLDAPDTTGTSHKEIDRTLQSVLRGIDPACVNLAIKLAEQFKAHGKLQEAERVYMRLAEIPNAPIFPQFITLLDEMGEYRKALKMIRIWKKAGNLADRAQIMKHETEISSRLMKPLIRTDNDSIEEEMSEQEEEKVEPIKARRPSHDGTSMLPHKHSQAIQNNRPTRAKRIKLEEGMAEKMEEERVSAASVENPPEIRNAKVIETLEKLLGEWNTEKVKGNHSPKTIVSLCQTIEQLLSQEASSFVYGNSCTNKIRLSC
eukprot:TRINITY_DN64320_c2_g1_i1.p3 TRINITY_DN64320_c2_g1~~TRINITY_DN64320_c2_g1_i1.p3  ORF type:complete len:486 (-),score=83.09 TRINITY_DN64320_c2_g1_i1:2905-4362(-)